jgi:hypothetical protein
VCVPEVSRARIFILLFSSLLSSLSFAKDKAVLPADVLRAYTVLVVIEPDAGEPLTNPGANSNAREDVERAITKWGRFKLVVDAQTADLIIAVRKGSGRAVTPTLSGGRVDDRPIVLQPGQRGDIRIGGQQGRPPDLSQTTGRSEDTQPRVQTEVGSSEDMLAVYRGRIEYPLNSPAVWRYMGKEALRPPVQALDEFRKALIEAEKVQNQKQKKNP